MNRGYYYSLFIFNFQIKESIQFMNLFGNGTIDRKIPSWECGPMKDSVIISDLLGEVRCSYQNVKIIPKGIIYLPINGEKIIPIRYSNYNIIYKDGISKRITNS